MILTEKKTYVKVYVVRKTKQKKEVNVLAYDYRKLRGRIREVCGTQDIFAEKIGVGRVTLSQRLNNQSEFSQDEIYRACEVLNLEKEEIPVYFFAIMV